MIQQLKNEILLIGLVIGAALAWGYVDGTQPAESKTFTYGHCFTSCAEPFDPIGTALGPRKGQ